MRRDLKCGMKCDLRRDMGRGLRRGSRHNRTAQRRHGDGATTVPVIATVENIKVFAACTIPAPARRHITAPSTSARSTCCLRTAHKVPHTQPRVCHKFGCADNNLGTSWCHCFYLADQPPPPTRHASSRFSTLCCPPSVPSPNDRASTAAAHLRHRVDDAKPFRRTAATSPHAIQFRDQKHDAGAATPTRFSGRK